MIKEYERELNELQESKLISKEDLHEGDEIVYNGEHYFVTRTDTGTDFVWITDDESERYNRNAQGWTVKADWIDEVIGQPEEDELKESLTKSDRDIILDVVKGKYETGHGYLEDKRDYEEALGRRLTDAKYEQLEEFYSDLMDLGPEGFYEEYKDILDFDPDFIAEYGYSEDDEEEDELEESLKEDLAVNGEETLVDTANEPAVKPAVIIIKVESSLSADGFEVTVKDAAGNIIDQHSFRYGYNASYSKLGVDKYRPFVTDIINRYLSKYNLNKDSIIVTKGRNVFKGTDVSDEDITDFKNNYLGNHLDESKNESLKENHERGNNKLKMMNESIDFTNAAEIRHRLDSYSGHYLTITFRGSRDWKYISDLLDEYNDGDEEEADLALDKLEAIYGSEYKLLKALEVDEISEITVYDSDVSVTIKVDKDDLYHNYADLINNPSIKKDTVKILELELNESLKKRYKKFLLKEDLDFTDEAEIRKQLDKYSGQYLTITFKGSEDWKHISDLLDESINSDEEEEEELALDKLEASYGREYNLLKSLEVEEISEIVAYTSYVIVTIRVEKDNLQHNFSDHYADLINMPSIDTGTIKILELDKPTAQNINTSSMTRDEMVDFIEDYIDDTSDDEYEKFKDEIALNFGLVWDNLKEDPEEWVYPSFTDNGLRTIIDKIIKAAKPTAESVH